LVGEAKPKLLVKLAAFVCVGVPEKRDNVTDTPFIDAVTPSASPWPKRSARADSAPMFRTT